jgi:4-hydroxy-2-oxoheptanedioate aldolase
MDQPLYRSFRSRLEQGTTLYGPFSHLKDPAVVEILAQEGFDFVAIDMEHGSSDLSTVENLVRAANGAGLATTVRVPENNESAIVHALDTGTQSIMVPHVSSAAEAAAVVRAARFAPLGERGVDAAARSASYGAAPMAEYFRRANEETLLIGQIEGREGLKNAAEICGTPGLDCVFMGPWDLSQALGVTGETQHPRVVETIRGLVDLVRRNGKIAGIFTGTGAEAAFWRQSGVGYIAISMDMSLLRRGARALREEIAHP